MKAHTFKKSIYTSNQNNINNKRHSLCYINAIPNLILKYRGGFKAGEYCAIIGAGPIGLVAGMVAQAYGGHAILLDLVQERLDFAKSLGIEYVINSGKEDAAARIAQITGGYIRELELNVEEADDMNRILEFAVTGESLEENK